jgi:antitoxin component YwqK of YwqJK toxin-antitoxin module
MKQILTILFFTYWMTCSCQTKNDTVNFNGINYYIFRGNFIWDNYQDPPDSLPDGHWIGYYSNKRVGFTGEYRNGKPYDTIKIYRENYNDSIKDIYNIDNIKELFFFKDGKAKYNEFRDWGRVNHPDWKIEQSRIFNKSNDTIIEIVYNDNARLSCKDIFILLNNELTNMTFFRIEENQHEACKQVIRYNYYDNGNIASKSVLNYKSDGYDSVYEFYNYKGKFKYKEVINYDRYHTDIDSTTKCYDNKGRLIKCRKSMIF